MLDKEVIRMSAGLDQIWARARSILENMSKASLTQLFGACLTRRLDYTDEDTRNFLSVLAAKAIHDICLQENENKYLPTGVPCPNCGEDDTDYLIWMDDEKVSCKRCGTVYKPKEE